jgi:NhaA family Na+:H+ antiporter
MSSQGTPRELLESLPIRPIDKLVRPLRGFAQHKLAGAFLLMGGAVAAVLLANSPFVEAYEQLLHLHLGVVIGPGHGEGFLLEKTLHHWINDGLMAIFFFVVGLEIKREVLAGELSSIRKAALPAVAALGGMMVPAILYATINPSGVGARGWGIPMATDIAFALGVLALLGDRVPAGLRIFLTALAIVDDIGAVLVIAVFYTDTLYIGSLVVGFLALVAAFVLNRLETNNPFPYLLLGLVAWLAFLNSGVHATIATLLMAFTIPARTAIDGPRLLRNLDRHTEQLKDVGVPAGRGLNTIEQQHALDHLARDVGAASAPLQTMEHGLNPLVTFLILPVFALANAGVHLGSEASSAFGDPITLGILAGLFFGKQLGITLFSFIAVRLGLADMPRGVSWLQVHGVAILGGVGFTMSLFIAELAFDDPHALEHAKVGILSASVLAGVVGAGLLYLTGGKTDAAPAAPSPGGDDQVEASP